MTKKYKKQTQAELAANAYLSGGSAPYIESLYALYQSDPSAVSSSWRDYFAELTRQEPQWVSHAPIREAMANAPRVARSAPVPTSTEGKQGHVDALITAYRRFGHLNADINPLNTHVISDQRLQLAFHHLTEADLETVFDTRGLLPAQQATLSVILARLKSIYCSKIGVEYSRITQDEERLFLQHALEDTASEYVITDAMQRRLLKKLVAAQGLEHYLDVRYPGQKRFSIEGTDSLIPLMDHLTQLAGQMGLKEIVIGMAHRGRLNVLLNVMGQTSQKLFDEFEGTLDMGLTTGDVKYHRGFSSDVATDHGAVHLSLFFNPSHLEFINPVVLGSVRSRQYRQSGERNPGYAMPVLIHGDAAFAGQGIVMETLNMSQTNAYGVGGTVHIIVNNQIGFTTHQEKDARSSHYCSDPAKMIDAPIFHVNADDPESVIRVIKMAFDYRMRFHKDVVIDLVGYRRHGHQEVDEPRATQPLMYQFIRSHDTVATHYAKQLIANQVVTQAEVDGWFEAYRAQLDAGEPVVDLLPEGLSHHYAENWTPFLNQSWCQSIDTGVAAETLDRLGKHLTTLPDGFVLQRNVDKIMAARRAMHAQETAVDWGYAENLAYASLIDAGHTVRLSGEDIRRGTFFHRHAALFDQKTGQCHEPLNTLAEREGRAQFYDSLLSEAGALGFEYGYALSDPNSLVIWEAQFGDFANGAQVIIDQFISSGCQKWSRLSGLVMLLPHGYEGMGPEHSSARLERYLQLSAQENMQVCVPSTPAQIFHLLRRQVIRPYRKPLIVMTPKSLLRHKLAVSALSELTTGQYQLVIPETDALAVQSVKRVVLCSGKVYYELLAMRREHGLDDIAIVRIEQLYPFPYEELEAALSVYPALETVVWCQEEPKNQGAWFCLQDAIRKTLPAGCVLQYAGRQPMAAPAGGYAALHKRLQSALLRDALAIHEEN